MMRSANRRMHSLVGGKLLIREGRMGSAGVVVWSGSQTGRESGGSGGDALVVMVETTDLRHLDQGRVCSAWSSAPGTSDVARR